jgi:hypothetical protein
MTSYKGISRDEFLAALTYDPETGELRWRFTRGARAPAGGLAGSLNKSGYRKINFSGKMLYAHRIAFLMHHGYLPAEVDHHNLQRGDNRAENLRPATRRQNSTNVAGRRSGLKGIHYCRQTGRYRAQIRAAGARVHLGRFDTEEQAHAAYSQMSFILNGSYGRV